MPRGFPERQGDRLDLVQLSNPSFYRDVSLSSQHRHSPILHIHEDVQHHRFTACRVTNIGCAPLRHCVCQAYCYLSFRKFVMPVQTRQWHINNEPFCRLAPVRCFSGWLQNPRMHMCLHNCHQLSGSLPKPLFVFFGPHCATQHLNDSNRIVGKLLLSRMFCCMYSLGCSSYSHHSSIRMTIRLSSLATYADSLARMHLDWHSVADRLRLLLQYRMQCIS